MYPCGDDYPTEPVDQHTSLHNPQQELVPNEAVAQKMHSHMANILSPDQESGRCYPRQFLLHWAMPVLDEETRQSLEYIQLRTYTKYQFLEWIVLGKTWPILPRLRQGIDGTNNQHVKGTETFKVIYYADIPVEMGKETTYTKVVCKVRPNIYNPDRTRITIGVNRSYYPPPTSNGTATGFLELVKLIINRI